MVTIRSIFLSDQITIYEKYLILILVSILFYFGMTSYTSDSEIWSVTLSRHAYDFSDDYLGVYQKPILGFILGLIYYFDLTSAQHLFVAKIIFTTIGVTSFLLFIRFALKELGKKWTYFFVLLLLTSSTYFSQFYRIRADILTLFFAAILLNFISKAKNENWSVIQSGVSYCAIGTLMFLSTPKSIYALLICAGYVFFKMQTTDKTKKQRLILAASIFIMPLLVIAAFGGIVFVSKEKLLLDIYGDSFRYFLRGYHFLHQFSLAKTFGIESQVMDTFFVKRSLRFDFLHFIGWLILLMYGIYLKLKKSFAYDIGFFWVGVMSLAAMFLHNQKLPFFWGSMMPFGILAMASFLKSIDISQKKLITIFMVLFLNIFVQYTPGNWWASGSIQLDAMNHLDQFLKNQNNPTLLDGIGILPRANYRLVLLGPNDKESADATIYILRNESPQVVLQLIRSQVIVLDFLQILKEKYTHIGQGVWILNSFYTNQTFSYPLNPWDVFEFEPGAVYMNAVSP